MPTYSWPLNKWIPNGGKFHVRAITQMSLSPYTGASKAAASGNVWYAEQTFPPQNDVEADAVIAFIEQLEGPVNPVWVPFWPRRRPRFFGLSGVGQPWSDGSFFDDGTGWLEPSWSLTAGVAALAGSKTLTLTGFPPSSAVLWRGDVLEVGQNMVRVMTDIQSDASGIAMVPVLPGLRRGILAGAPVTVDSPRVLMRLAADSGGEIEYEIVNSRSFTLRFVEAIDVP